MMILKNLYSKSFIGKKLNIFNLNSISDIKPILNKNYFINKEIKYDVEPKSTSCLIERVFHSLLNGSELITCNHTIRSILENNSRNITAIFSTNLKKDKRLYNEIIEYQERFNYELHPFPYYKKKLERYNYYNDETIKHYPNSNNGIPIIDCKKFLLKSLFRDLFIEENKTIHNVLVCSKYQLGKNPLSLYKYRQNIVSSILNKISIPPFRSTDNNNGLWLLCYKVQDPMNLGSILRSCSFFNIDGILLSDQCCNITPIVARASVGSSESLQIMKLKNVEDFLEVCIENNWDIITTVDSKSKIENIQMIHEINMTKKTLLIIGNEGSGIPETIIRKYSTIISTIPSYTNKEPSSLNVSNSTSILLHQLTIKKK
eukprot:TRINITY_DN5952_c0_g1_i1.p1 TRINITY_DN5952_c0_g1~~TRINITY_DN5952_c0_g1_i1.p1  ORF type:complete len:373 (+),score=37.25 TRINITY_DN5952_c0_g1_i1:46-1164(+)